MNNLKKYIVELIEFSKRSIQNDNSSQVTKFTNALNEITKIFESIAKQHDNQSLSASSNFQNMIPSTSILSCVLTYIQIIIVKISTNNDRNNALNESKEFNKTNILILLIKCLISTIKIIRLSHRNQVQDYKVKQNSSMTPSSGEVIMSTTVNEINIPIEATPATIVPQPSSSSSSSPSSLSPSISLPVFTILVEINDEILWRLILLLTNILDQYKYTPCSSPSSYSSSSSSAGVTEVYSTNSDKEIICESSFLCLIDILSLWKDKYILLFFTNTQNNIDDTNIAGASSISPPQNQQQKQQSTILLEKYKNEYLFTLSKLQGPYIANIVQNCLCNAKQPSKAVATASLSCLISICELAPVDSDWRVFIPGIFSSLYSVCNSGYKRYVCLHYHIICVCICMHVYLCSYLYGVLVHIILSYLLTYLLIFNIEALGCCI